MFGISSGSVSAITSKVLAFLRGASEQRLSAPRPYQIVRTTLPSAEETRRTIYRFRAAVQRAYRDAERDPYMQGLRDESERIGSSWLTKEALEEFKARQSLVRVPLKMKKLIVALLLIRMLCLDGFLLLIGFGVAERLFYGKDERDEVVYSEKYLEDFER